MDRALFRTPSGLLPIAIALAALTTVMIHIAVFGTAPQTDEGTAAHVWQLLMAAELPAMLFFAAKWLPAKPIEAAVALTVQLLCVLAAIFPVWWFRW